MGRQEPVEKRAGRDGPGGPRVNLTQESRLQTNHQRQIKILNLWTWGWTQISIIHDGGKAVFLFLFSSLKQSLWQGKSAESQMQSVTRHKQWWLTIAWQVNPDSVLYLHRTAHFLFLFFMSLRFKKKAFFFPVRVRKFHGFKPPTCFSPETCFCATLFILFLSF